MGISTPTRDAVRELLRVIAEGRARPSGDPAEGAKAGPIPRGASEAAGQGYVIAGEGLAAYNHGLGLLAGEPELEHLSPREIDDELWRLVCEALEGRDEYGDGQTRAKAVKSFLKRIARPWQEHLAVAPVENLTTTVPEAIDLPGATLRRFDARLADDSGFTKTSLWQRRSGELLGKLVVMGKVQAGSPERASQRGADLLDDALNALRVALVGSAAARIWDEQLLFRRGPILVDLAAEERGASRLQVTRPFHPWGFELLPGIVRALAPRLAAINVVASGDFPEAISKQVVRAIHWIGTSITRESHDDKVIDLCTAQEALLTTQDDRKKGERIALRTVLLASRLGNGFPDQAETLALYELRSKVVHGTEIRACGARDYETLLGRSLAVLSQYLQLVGSDSSITKPSKAIAAMEQIDSLRMAIEWFEVFPAEGSKKIAAVGRETLAFRQGSAS